MRRSPVPSIAPGTFSVAQSWADCTTNVAGFNLRQAQRLLAFPTRTSAARMLALADREISRFPSKERPHMPVSTTTPDRLGARKPGNRFLPGSNKTVCARLVMRHSCDVGYLASVPGVQGGSGMRRELRWPVK
jgi:hypothetical protein